MQSKERPKFTGIYLPKLKLQYVLFFNVITKIVIDIKSTLIEQ